jgi:hypothetical protein
MWCAVEQCPEVGGLAPPEIVVTPTWAKLIDFETTPPSAVEELIRQRDERERH